MSSPCFVHGEEWGIGEGQSILGPADSYDRSCRPYTPLPPVATSSLPLRRLCPSLPSKLPRDYLLVCDRGRINDAVDIHVRNDTFERFIKIIPVFKGIRGINRANLYSPLKWQFLPPPATFALVFHVSHDENTDALSCKGVGGNVYLSPEFTGNPSTPSH